MLQIIQNQHFTKVNIFPVVFNQIDLLCISECFCYVASTRYFLCQPILIRIGQEFLPALSCLPFIRERSFDHREGLTTLKNILITAEDSLKCKFCALQINKFDEAHIILTNGALARRRSNMCKGV